MPHQVEFDQKAERTERKKWVAPEVTLLNGEHTEGKATFTPTESTISSGPS